MEQNKSLPAKLEKEKKYFLEQNSPLNLSVSLTKNDIRTPLAAIKGDYKSLAIIRKEFGGEALFDFVIIWLVKLNEYVFGRSEKQMTEYQISETAMLVIDTYYYLNIAEVAIVFKKIKTGGYGKIFGELNGMFILEAFSQYHTERMRALKQIHEEQESEKRKKIQDESIEYVPMPASVKAKIAAMQEKFNPYKHKELPEICKCGKETDITKFHGMWICKDCLSKMLAEIEPSDEAC